jgi:hypothetical protein
MRSCFGVRFIVALLNSDGCPAEHRVAAGRQGFEHGRAATPRGKAHDRLTCNIDDAALIQQGARGKEKLTQLDPRLLPAG